jgi:uncharacterized protein (TIGR02646 family)
MIQIDRSNTSAPAQLVADGQHERDTVIEPKALAHPPTLKSDDFKRSLYSSDAVRNQLWDSQHGKCCFCEKELEISFATVEHFRPKTSAKDDAGSTRTGYWWLGYEFENLYLCCSNCNTPKGNFFPLAANGAALAVGTLPAQADPAEDALILDPGVDDPELHINWVFISHKGFFPVGLDERGKATIKATQLDTRDKLAKHRARHYEKHIVPLIRRHKRAQQNHDDDALADVQKDAQLLAEADSAYVGMTRALLKQQGML